MTSVIEFETGIKERFEAYANDWCLFAREYLRVNLDPEQEAVLQSVQYNPMTAVASGTSRGKDMICAVASLCFLYLTPRWDDAGNLIGSSKVYNTAPTQRQVQSIMIPELSKIFINSAYLPGSLNTSGIKLPYRDWFLSAFKADDHNADAWQGFHAANLMFVVTEASGIPEKIFESIEGCLQGNSRLLIAFNHNLNSGYADAAMKSPRFTKFRLNSLNAPNVKAKRIIYPGQVDYGWIADKIATWCMRIPVEQVSEIEGDFEWEGQYYRPSDLFRVKCLGLGPREAEGQLVPLEWIEAANRRHKEFKKTEDTLIRKKNPLRLGVDVAGMGRDSTCFCFRYGNVVEPFQIIQSAGIANHMEIVGIVMNILRTNTDAYSGLFPQAFIDSIGEGAGVLSRLEELAKREDNDWLRAHSCKFSTKTDRKDATGQYEFDNMRAYLFWMIRDWLNPLNKREACLAPDDLLTQELTATRWKFQSNGKIIIEPKEELKKRLKRSPDRADSLANTFFPVDDVNYRRRSLSDFRNMFH